MAEDIFRNIHDASPYLLGTCKAMHIACTTYQSAMMSRAATSYLSVISYLEGFTKGQAPTNFCQATQNAYADCRSR